MPHSSTYQAIVLKVHDVGEADRFCILLTRERGKLAARARGVRKLTSKMGGTILPLRSIEVELHEGSAGFLVTNAKPLSPPPQSDAQSFTRAQHGVELLLHLLHDDEPVPEIYDLAEQFFAACDQDLTLPFTIRLLELLGLMPSPREGNLGRAISDEELAFVEVCQGEEWQTPPEISSSAKARLTKLCQRILQEQTSRQWQVATTTT